MKISKLILLVCVALLLIFRCTPDDTPFLSKAEAEKQIEALNNSRDPFYSIRNVVAIINNDIYYFKRLDSIPKRLTNTATAVKTNVKLSYDRSRIAYLDQSNIPVIIRADNGQQIQKLSQYGYVSSIDWAKDRLTLYMLVDGKVVFNGTPLPVTQPIGTWDQISSFSMNSIGDQAYYFNSPFYFTYTLKFLSSGQKIDDQFTSISSKRYDYVDFYDNKGNFLIGLTESSYDKRISQIACIQNYQFYEAYYWDDDDMYTPDFNSDLEVLIFGTYSGSSNYIKCVYLGKKAYNSTSISPMDILRKTITNYPSKSTIYLDWVQ